MKKFFLMMTAVLALSLVSCNGNKDYKAEGQELSKQLDEVVEKNDTAAALTTDESIREMEQEIVALGDSAALADFRAAMKDSRIRNAAFVTVGKIRNGMDKNEALNELVQDALDEDIDVNAITAAVNAILAAEMKQNTKKAEK
jgi:hypothetical protein